MIMLERDAVGASATPVGSGQPAAQENAGAENPSESSQQSINVGQSERAISVAAGAALTLLGISRRSIPGLLVAAVGGGLVYRGLTGHCDLYDKLGYDTSKEGSAEDHIEARGIHVEQAFLINRSPQDLYTFWRDFKNLPQFMSHIDRIDVQDDRKSHWVARITRTLGGYLEWDAEITRDEPNSAIAWHSLPGSDIDITGEIRFAPALGDRGTEVHVTLSFVPPGGAIAQLFPSLFRKSTRLMMQEDLRKFKQLMEVGEMATVDGQPHGTCTGQGSYYRDPWNR